MRPGDGPTLASQRLSRTRSYKKPLRCQSLRARLVDVAAVLILPCGSLAYSLSPDTTAVNAFNGFARTQSDFDVIIVFGFARRHLCWAHSCCNQRHGPRGDSECWDEVFGYDVCCLPEERV